MTYFSSSASDQALVERVKDFVANKVIPYEKDSRCTSHGPTEALRKELNQLAREAGLLSLHVEPEWGGIGLNQSQRALVFEAAGYSVLGPIALNCAAPAPRSSRQWAPAQSNLLPQRPGHAAIGSSQSHPTLARHAKTTSLPRALADSILCEVPRLAHATCNANLFRKE